jgi:hypothetical protein
MKRPFPPAIMTGIAGPRYRVMLAVIIDGVVEGFENSVRQPVLPHELPDIFLAVEFRRASTLRRRYGY